MFDSELVSQEEFSCKGNASSPLSVIPTVRSLVIGLDLHLVVLHYPIEALNGRFHWVVSDAVKGTEMWVPNPSASFRGSRNLNDRPHRATFPLEFECCFSLLHHLPVKHSVTMVASHLMLFKSFT